MPKGPPRVGRGSPPLGLRASRPAALFLSLGAAYHQLNSIDFSTTFINEITNNQNDIMPRRRKRVTFYVKPKGRKRGKKVSFLTRR